MPIVFVVHHEYEQWGKESYFFIGVYSTRELADSAVARLKIQPGFCDWPDGFTISEYTLDEDHWTEGFMKLIPINVRIKGTNPPEWCVVHAIWRPGDLYQIFASVGDDPAGWEFSPGQTVRCREEEFEGRSGVLFAESLAY